MKIAICLPSFGHPKIKFVSALSGLLLWSARQPVTYNGSPTTPEILLLTSERMLIGAARDVLSQKAIDLGADYLFWIDDDQTFPPESMFRLIGHDLPVVGANYPRRDPDNLFSSAANVVGSTITTIKARPEGLEPVDTIGLGCAIMKAEIFDGLPKPWFTGGEFGEDAHFFELLAKERGIRPVVDHGLRVGHVAETVLIFGDET
jgi:hypothetical protein